MSNIDRIPIKDAPRLMDAVVQEVQVQLGDADVEDRAEGGWQHPKSAAEGVMGIEN